MNLITKVSISLSLIGAAGLTACYSESRRTSTYRDMDGNAYTSEEIVYVQEAPRPPAMLRETIAVQPGHDYVWIAGQHEWRRGGWEWVPGHWERPRHQSANYVPAHWERQGNGWAWRRGYWN